MHRLKSYGRLLLDTILVPLYVLMPRSRKRIVFGAWQGRQFGCNPKHLMKYILAHDASYTCIWVGQEKLRGEVLAECPTAKFARMGSALAFWYCITSKWLVCNINWVSDIARIPRCRRSTVINLMHGIPNKSTGSRQLNGVGEASYADRSEKGWLRKFFNRLLIAYDDFLYGQESWISVSGEWMAKILEEAHKGRFARERMLFAGQPRNDFVVNGKDDADLKRRLKEKMAKVLGIDPKKSWWIYVPTWRHSADMPFSFSTAQRKADFAGLFQTHNVVMIEKQHPATMEKFKLAGGASDGLCIVSREQSLAMDVQELLLCCDRLISDYSAIYYDFALTGRPIVEWTYDYDAVATKDFGLEYDLREYAPGPFAYTEDELLSVLSRSDSEILAAQSPKMREHIMYDHGQACATVYDFIAHGGVK